MPAPDSIRIRTYAPTDRDAVLAMSPRLTEGMPPWRDPIAWLSAVRSWVRDSADSATQPGHALYVAVAGDRVVGFVSAAERTHFTGQVDAYVGELVTAAGMERRGIASALMAAAEAWAADHGLRCLTLETGAANQTARSFYAALGYLEEDVRLTKRIQNETG
jgi:ribosomal protein S18 acetylase RimI-like enzyme